MSRHRSHDEFAYLGDVLQSDLTPSAKLFFTSLITHFAFRARFGLYRSEWNDQPEHRECIKSLEEAGFLAVEWENDRVRYVMHRDWIGIPLPFRTCPSPQIDS